MEPEEKKQLDQGDKSKNCLTIYEVVTNNSKKFCHIYAWMYIDEIDA